MPKEITEETTTYYKGKPTSLEELQAYIEYLGFTPEEAASIAPNWLDRPPQTMAEVEAGRRWEEAARLKLSEPWATEL